MNISQHCYNCKHQYADIASSVCSTCTRHRAEAKLRINFVPAEKPCGRCTYFDHNIMGCTVRHSCHNKSQYKQRKRRVN